MKSFWKKTISVLLTTILILSMASCSKTEKSEGLWNDATYTENTEIGKGDKTVTVTVTAEEKSVDFTVHTDKETLGNALLEHKLISGEKGEYGLYVKTVNGIYADYDITKSYWSVEKNGKYMMIGVDSEKIENGTAYEFIYTKN